MTNCVIFDNTCMILLDEGVLKNDNHFQFNKHANISDYHTLGESVLTNNVHTHMIAHQMKSFKTELVVMLVTVLQV